MVDLLTHVLATYVVCGSLAAAGRVPDRLVPVAMVGAAVPDLSKAVVVLPPAVADALGTPVALWGFHTVGGVLCCSLAGAALFDRRGDAGRAFGALVAGGLGHLLLDLGVVRADATAPPYLFPLTGWLPPAANLYRSADLWPLAVALAATATVYAVRSGRVPLVAADAD